ncbi:hypothetical protein ERJ75_001086100 [Trypanosoma vivax]|nr:hypothetical protein ERJ75_001086100 [Trypanosoma vivax]
MCPSATATMRTRAHHFASQLIALEARALVAKQARAVPVARAPNQHFVRVPQRTSLRVEAKDKRRKQTVDNPHSVLVHFRLPKDLLGVMRSLPLITLSSVSPPFFLTSVRSHLCRFSNSCVSGCCTYTITHRMFLEKSAQSLNSRLSMAFNLSSLPVSVCGCVPLLLQQDNGLRLVGTTTTCCAHRHSRLTRRGLDKKQTVSHRKIGTHGLYSTWYLRSLADPFAAVPRHALPFSRSCFSLAATTSFSSSDVPRRHAADTRAYQQLVTSLCRKASNDRSSDPTAARQSADTGPPSNTHDFEIRPSIIH